MSLRSFLEKRSSHSLLKKGELEKKVKLAQEGNQEVRNMLIRQSATFISQVTSKVCKRYIDPAKDDEFSVALAAFDEAIMQYTKEKGKSFLSFADLVIRRRVIDFIRKQVRHCGQLSLEHSVERVDKSDLSPLEIQMSLQQYKLDREASLRREEIQHYKEKLKEYNIDLMALADRSPKHSDARENAIQTARLIVGNTKLRSLFLEKRKLPINELLKQVTVSRKTIDRNRMYIVAIVLLLIEDYQYLQYYLYR
ncbi:RNA polymerase sigma-I factor [Ammoniphilus sp. 3BR4]|uniref:RNA polymerase sigma-I factor n=1 Tax=Ammoniphilus sp. 3BR4 TaxID=3158265 RepID=UPI0034655F5D